MKRESIIQGLRLLGLNQRDWRDGAYDIMVRCPLAPWRHEHSPEKKPSLGIKIDDNDQSVCHCYGCKFKGSFLTFVLKYQELSGKDLSEVVEYIEREERYSFDWDTEFEEISETQTKPLHLQGEKSKQKNDTVLRSWKGWVHPYIEKRKFLETTIMRWEIGWDKDRKMITIPLRDRHGELKGCIGRPPTPNARYINYPGTNVKDYLLGEHLARKGTKAIVVEGTLDAPKVWQHLKIMGLDNYSVYALLKSELGYKQMQTLVRYSDEVLIFLDDDKAGKYGSWKVYQALRDQLPVYRVEYPEKLRGKDLDPDKLIDKFPKTAGKMILNPKFVF